MSSDKYYLIEVIADFMKNAVKIAFLFFVFIPFTDRALAQEQPQPQEKEGTVSVKFEKGTRIAVDNSTTGPIIVIGWDRDVIEATAMSDRGIERVRIKTGFAFDSPVISLTATYAERERTEKLDEDPNAGPQKLLRDIGSFMSRPFQNFARQGEIFFEVKVPRSAELEPIRVFRSDVVVTGVTTNITVVGEKSPIRLKNVGSAEVRTQSGEVEIDGTSGLADVITTSGVISVRNAGGDVRALSLNGRIDIDCAQGRVDASNTDARITIRGARSDVSATTTYSFVQFRGPIRNDGRYYLKSMSGSVEMETPADSPGFTVSLSSYRGQVETDFDLKTTQPKVSSPGGRRMIGRRGNGSAHITLDSFDGSVRLKKLAANAPPLPCN